MSVAPSTVPAVPDLHAVSHRLKYLRGRLALNQAEVAEEIGVARRTFQYWEDSARATPLSACQRMADYYSIKLGEPIDVEWIFRGEGRGPEVPSPPVGLSPETLAAINARFDVLRAELLAELATVLPPGALRRLGEKRADKRDRRATARCAGVDHLP